MKFRKKLGILVLMASLVASTVGCSGGGAGAEKQVEDTKVTLNISAAASLKEAMAELQEEYAKEDKQVTLTVNFGGSGSLQQQIEQGAPCDVFISAGKKQMDALDKGHLLLEDTYKNLVKNELVLISLEDSKVTSMGDLTTDKVKHIGVGEPKSVPAGKYADEVLTNLKIKDLLKDKLVFAKDVKEVLAWTKAGNADVGFVYYSDAINTNGVKIIETIQEEMHSPIIYPVAVIKASKNADEAKKFEEFLLGDKAQEILAQYGYKAAQ